jgi:hypothetical protein
VTAVVRDHGVVAGAVLRVRRGDEVVGGAFLVAPDLVATTPGVVAAALGADPGTREPPAGAVLLDFPLLQSQHDVPPTVSAQVQRWTTDPDGAPSPALLRLAAAAPSEGRMPPLRQVEQLAGRSFSVLGFPSGLADGVWTTGHLASDGDDPRLRLVSAAGEHPVDAGFSGAPVWESGTGAVVGMAVHQRDGGARLLPIHEVLGFDPEQLPCPYQGMRTFDEGDAEGFFGRDDDIERLFDLVQQRSVVAVAGPSGAGKSSLVRAGLVPRLRAAGAEIVYLRAEPDALDEAPQPAGDGRELVLVIDQFEELAALDPPGARNLLEAVLRRTGAQEGPRVRAVLTLRWTTLDELLTPELIGPLGAGTALVGPLDRARLRDAIVRPAERPPGLAFEPGLVETILDDAGAEPGRLPLVEALLADLWQRRAGGFLTLREYEAAGGVAGALAQQAEAVVGSLPAGSDDAVRALLTALARPDREGRFVRRPVPLADLPAAQRALVPDLVAGRLLTVGRAGTDDVVELAHQALIDHWPRLGGWLVADREFLAWREQVSDQRDRWEAENRADSALLRGVPLVGAAEWLPARGGDLSGPDLDYLRRSAARERREVRRLRITAAAVAVLVLAAAVLTVVSVRSSDQIAAQLAANNADALGRESRARAPQDPAAAAQLALAAWREDPHNSQARTALLESYLAMRSVERELPGLTASPITGLLLGGDTAVLRAYPHPVVVTGLSGPAPRRVELSDVQFDGQLALSPDGRWLATQNPDRTRISVRDVETGSPPVPLAQGAVTGAGLPAFSPDSERLAWVEWRGEQAALRIWDLRADTDVPHGIPSLFPDVFSVSPTPDGEHVIVRRGDIRKADSRLVVLALADATETGTLPPGALVVQGGTAVVTCGAGDGAPGSTGTVVVTPLDGSPPRRIGLSGPSARCGPTGGLLNPRLSSSGNALVDHADGTTTRITDLRTGHAFQVTAPADLPPTMLAGFDVVETFDIAAERPVGILARGSSLLWLRAEPLSPVAPRDGGILTVDGDVRLVSTPGRLRAEERTTGRVLGEVSGVGPAAHFSVRRNSLYIGEVVDDGWDVARYEIPTLRRTGGVRLPSRDGGAPPGDRGNRPGLALEVEPTPAGERLIAIADGLLGVWDPASGRMVGPPTRLGSTDLGVGFHRTLPHMQVRPGHPGQVAVVGIDEVQVWDAPLGRLVASLPAAPWLDELDRYRSPVAFDATGDRLAVLTRDRTVQLSDVEPARLARAPIPTPATRELLGFDADGYLVTGNVGDVGVSPTRLAFLDVVTGAEAGSVDTTDAIRPLRIGYLTEDRRTIRLDDLGDDWVLDLPATAQAWRDALCTAFGRELTAGERAILPPGTNTEPPCS